MTDSKPIPEDAVERAVEAGYAAIQKEAPDFWILPAHVKIIVRAALAAAFPGLADGSEVVVPVEKVTRQMRDRPAAEPGGCECMTCGAIFIGAECHTECALCAAALRARAGKA